MVLVQFTNGTQREIFGANHAELRFDKFIVMKWMKGDQRFGIVNVFSADDVVKADIIDRGKTQQIVLGRGIQERID